MAKSYLDIKVRTIAVDGKFDERADVPIRDLIGCAKAILVVNVASKWGYTQNDYEQIVELEKKYGVLLHVILVPCNQFAEEEPDSEPQIVEFASQFGFSGTIIGKTEVKGDGKHELYKWFAEPEQTNFKDHEPSWNFAKYLLNRDGPFLYYAPDCPPLNFSETIKLIVESWDREEVKLQVEVQSEIRNRPNLYDIAGSELIEILSWLNCIWFGT